ncbi:hypothetical protein IPP27_00006 [Streptococcus phage IPP27]|nr:hypothetical protein IPP27_00006 [Streptococcus phage IPP27]
MKTILRKISNTLFSLLLISAGIGLELLLLSITKYQLDLSDITQNFQQSLLAILVAFILSASILVILVEIPNIGKKINKFFNEAFYMLFSIIFTANLLIMLGSENFGLLATLFSFPFFVTFPNLLKKFTETKNIKIPVKRCPKYKYRHKQDKRRYKRL